MAPKQTGITQAGKRRWIVILTLVLVSLIGVIAITERQRLTATAAVQLLPIEQADTIFIRQKNGDMELQKQQGLWRLTAPTDATVNQDRITPLLALLTLPDSTAYPVIDVDLDELGLSDPHATLRINDHTFIFGGPGPGEHQRYLMIEDHVYLTRDILLPLIASGADSLITPAAE